MTKDKMSITDEEYGNELNRAFKLGVSSGWGQASSWLLQESISAFSNHHDELAMRLRQLSDNAKLFGEKEHPNIKKEK